MELGLCTLSDIMKIYQQNQQQMPDDLITKIFFTLYEAVASFHQSNLSHRDIKPDNIIFS